jgi:hypothetical protein
MNTREWIDGVVKSVNRVLWDTRAMLRTLRSAAAKGWRPLHWTWTRVSGTDLNELEHSDKSEYGTLTTLSTFAVAQGAALVALVQGRGRYWVGWLIYFGLFCVTVWGVSSFLRFRIGDVAEKRGYDKGTIRYGRWVLKVIVLLFMGISLFFVFNLIPGQQKRVPFEDPLFPASVRFASELVPRNEERYYSPTEKEEQRMKRFFKRLDDARPPKKEGKDPHTREPLISSRLLAVSQTKEFREHYLTFDIKIDIKEPYRISDALAFLTINHEETAEYRPLFRQMPFYPNPKNPDVDGNTFQAYLPNKGERCLVFLEVTRTDNEPFSSSLSAASFFVKLIPNPAR